MDGKGFINRCETATPALFNAGKCGLNAVLGGYCGGFSENEHAVWRVAEAWNCRIWHVVGLRISTYAWKGTQFWLRETIQVVRHVQFYGNQSSTAPHLAS